MKATESLITYYVFCRNDPLMSIMTADSTKQPLVNLMASNHDKSETFINKIPHKSELLVDSHEVEQNEHYIYITYPSDIHRKSTDR